jgi:thioredoxin 1
MNTKTRKNSVIVLAIIILPLLIVSCSKQENQSKNGNQKSQKAETLQPDSGKTVQTPVRPAKEAVESIGNLDSLNAIIEGTPGKLLVFDLYADWCKPCKILAPTFDALAKDYAKNARFFRIDIQTSSDIASAFGVRGIPFVVFIKDKEVVHSLTGLNPRESYERVFTTCGPSVPAAECKTKLGNNL